MKALKSFREALLTKTFLAPVLLTDARPIQSRVWLPGSTYGLLATVTVCLYAAAAASAQVATASINGRIVDQTNAAVPNVPVTATLTTTGYVANSTANGEGFFQFSSLPVGAYTIRIVAPGFAAYQQTNVVVNVGESRTLNVALSVGVSNEEVTVTAATVAVDSTTATVQKTIDQAVVEGLPLNGRNPATLAFTVAGVTDSTLNTDPLNTNSTVKAADSAPPSESAPSVHGARPGGTYFSLDGASNTDPFSVIGAPFPNPDATGEFTVVTGTYGAQYVSAPGGAINIITRTGTNRVHGTVFEFIRNGYFNARRDFSTQADVLKRNQFGFAAGAPLLRDRLFLFASYQATPTSDSQTSVSFFPTAAQRTGDFGTFKIPSFLLSPTIQKVLKTVPVGTGVNGQLSFQIPQKTNDQQAALKMDYNVGTHRLFVRGFYDRYTQQAQGATPSALSAAAHTGIIQPFMSMAVGDNWTHGGLVLQSTASYSRVLSTTTLSPGTLDYSTLGLTNLSGYPLEPGLSLQYVVGLFGAGGNSSPEQFPRKQFQITQNAFLAKGRHQLSFGYDYRRISLDENNTSGQNPIAVYAGVNSLILGQIGVLPGASLNATADFLLGAPYIFFQQDGFYSKVSGNLFGLYGEDSVRLSRKLTLTAGLRWDPSFPYTPAGGRVTCYVPGSKSAKYVNAPTGLLFPGDNGCQEAGAQRSLLEFQPRVGLAYQANGGTTAVRAGYGRYDLQFPLNAYVGFSAQPFSRTYQITQPFLSIDNLWASAGLTNPFSNGFQSANYVPPADVAFSSGQSASTFDRNFRPAYIQQWSLSVQQQLTKKDQVEIAYVGTGGIHLTLGVGANTPAYIPGTSTGVAGSCGPLTGASLPAKGTACSSTSNEQARRPNQNFGNIYDLQSSGTSSYNGVDLTFRHQSKRFAINSAFTWSKALDASTIPVSAGAFSIATPTREGRRGRSDFDQNFEFRNTVLLNGPSFSGMNYASRFALADWALSGLAIVDAGQPFSILDGADNSLTGIQVNGMPGDYADRVPGVPLYANGQLNAAAFTNNAPGTFGNSGRNAYRAPSDKDVDVAAIKQFPIRQELGLTFRAEAFNVFNHPNLIPSSSTYTYGTSTFGAYNQARPQRVMQFSLKLAF